MDERRRDRDDRLPLAGRRSSRRRPRARDRGEPPITLRLEQVRPCGRGRGEPRPRGASVPLRDAGLARRDAADAAHRTAKRSERLDGVRRGRGPPLRPGRRLLDRALAVLGRPAAAEADPSLAGLERGELLLLRLSRSRRPPTRACSTTRPTAISSVDPGARVLLGGLYGRPRGALPKAMRAAALPAELYAIPGIRRLFDEVAVHPYAAHAGRMIRLVEGVRRVIVDNHDDAGLLITEFGWGSQNDSRCGQLRARPAAARPASCAAPTAR